MAKREPRETPRKTKLDIDVPDEGIGSLDFWLGELEDSENRLRDLVGGWRKDLETYNGAKFSLPNIDPADVVNVNVPFYTAEGKQPNLFYTTPFIQASGEMTETKEAAPMVQALMNKRLGRGGVNAKRMMDQVIKDMLVTAGLGATKIGYERVNGIRKVPKMVQAIDPMTQQPRLDGQGQAVMVPAVGDDGKPIEIDEKIKIYDSIYWKHFSICQLRLPTGFTSSLYDESPWIAWAFPLPGALIKEHGLSEGSLTTFSDDLLMTSEQDSRKLRETPMGYEIWYRPSRIDGSDPNPERVRQLVIVPGRSKRGRAKTSAVLLHRDSPWQLFDDDGRFLQGMRGYPIHVFTLRDRPESAFPRSDASVLRDVGEERSMGRTLMVQQRRRNLPMVAIDKTQVNKDVVDQIERGRVQQIILFDGPIGEDAIRPLERSSFPVENFQFDVIAQQDIDRLAASGANQQSLSNVRSDTATEATYIQRAYDNRLSMERERVLDDYLSGAEKYFSLVQLFADEDEVVEVIGEDNAKQLMTWNKTKIQGRFGFSLKPDSSERTNAAEERELWLRLFNLIVNAPGIDVVELIKITVAKFNVNPETLIQKTPPPAEPPAKLSVSVSINPSIDMNPQNPAYANTLHLLKLGGIDMPPQQGPIASAEGVPPVNQHDSELTGGIPGAGVPG
jgi:hypothetical protein